MTTRDSAPKTWPSGEKAAERIQEEREKQKSNPDGDEENIIDDLQWKQNVTDLHKVMEVAKSLWLLHEHSNEAMIRTALEIAMDRRCKKVLWWPDFWFSDHDKREHFKEIVRVKLAIALAQRKGTAVELDFDKQDEGDSELVQSLRRQIAELEAALRAARAAQAAAEARCRELEEIADEARKRAAALEKAMDTLRKEARSDAKEVPVAANNSGFEEELKRLKQQLAISEEKNKKLEEEIAALKKQLSQKGTPDDEAGKTKKSGGDGDLAAAQKRIEELEKQIKALRKQIAELQKGKPQVERKTTEKAASDDGDLDDLQKQLDAERKRREELEEELEKMKAKLELMQKELELEKKKAADLQAQLKAALAAQQGYKPPAAVAAAAEPQVIEVGGMTAEQLAELEELRAKAAQVDKLLAKLKKRDQQIASLQEENERLNEEQMKLLKMLKQVREQLRIVMELAEKKGLGDVIKKLFEEAGLADTMADPEYTCFDRLYDDALRRMDKQRRLEWFRLGNTGEPPAWFKGKNPYRRRGDSSPGRTGAGSGTGASQRDGSAGGGVSTIYCRNCGFPVQNPWRSGSPEPEASRAQSLESRSPPPNLYHSASPTYVELEREGREHSRQRTPSQGSRSRGQNMRSQSPPTAHALDMRIDVVKHGEGGMAFAVANFSLEDSHGWDAPAGVAAPIMKRPNPMQSPDLARMSRSGPNFNRGPGQLQHQQLDPLQGPGGAKGRSRSPPVDRSGGQRTMTSQQRMARSTSDLRGNLPRLAGADASPPMRQSPPLRTLAGSSSAAEIRHGGAAYSEAPMPIPGGGHARMRGVMLVEHPRAPVGAEDGPRMMWRPHKVSPEMHKPSAGGWGPGGFP